MLNLPIHVVNLKRREDRKTKLIKEFEKHKIRNYVFHEAVDGLEITPAEMNTLNPLSSSYRKLRNGEIGCYLSHLSIFNSILESSNELHLILEDDVSLISGFELKLNNKLKNVINVEWDIFYIGTNYDDDNYLGIYVAKDIYYPEKISWGTHGYLIKKEAVKKIINQMQPIIFPIDTYLMERAGLKKLVLVNPIVKVVDYSDSDTK